MTKVEMSCSLPVYEVNTVNELNLSIGKGVVKGGHATEEWDNGFRPRPKERTTKTEDKAAGTQSTVTKLPNANIATLKVSEQLHMRDFETRTHLTSEFMCSSQ
jgi:hypothetical protein